MNSWTLHRQWDLPDEKRHAGMCAGILPLLSPGQVWLLEGPVGAGKTTFMRYLTRALGHRGLFQSPTFTLVQEYGPFSRPPEQVRHADLYRLMGGGNPEGLGLFEDDFSGAVFIEWGSGFPEVATRATHRLELEIIGDGRRATCYVRPGQS